MKLCFAMDEIFLFWSASNPQAFSLLFHVSTLFLMQIGFKSVTLNQMELKDLFPEQPEFYLSSMNKKYRLRLPTIADAQHIVNVYGGGDTVKAEAWIAESLNGRKWDNICKIIYPLLEDKSDFLAKKKPIIDPDGVEKEHFFTGPELLLEALRSVQESFNMLTAYFSAKAAAEPVFKEMVGESLKKNAILNSSIGEKSSTSLPVSTDTLQNSLEP